MSTGTQRTIFRWIHLVLGIPIAGYIYSPFQNIPDYAPAVRYVFFPLLVLTGLWMWKGATGFAGSYRVGSTDAANDRKQAKVRVQRPQSSLTLMAVWKRGTIDGRRSRGRPQ